MVAMWQLAVAKRWVRRRLGSEQHLIVLYACCAQVTQSLGTPRAYVKLLVELEDFLNKTLAGELWGWRRQRRGQVGWGWAWGAPVNEGGCIARAVVVARRQLRTLRGGHAAMRTCRRLSSVTRKTAVFMSSMCMCCLQRSPSCRRPTPAPSRA